MENELQCDNSVSVGSHIKSAKSNSSACVSYEKTRMSLLDLGPVLFGDIDGLIAWFQRKKLLSSHVTCPSCGTAMTFQERNDIQDKRRYKIYKRLKKVQKITEQNND